MSIENTIKQDSTWENSYNSNLTIKLIGFIAKRENIELGYLYSQIMNQKKEEVDVVSAAIIFALSYLMYAFKEDKSSQKEVFLDMFADKFTVH